MSRTTFGVLIITLGLLVGCNSEPGNSFYTTPSRMANGLVIILPGIEGVSSNNINIRRGLESSGSNKAMPIHSWGRPIPGIGMLLNQADFVGNKLAGVRIARMIEQYQDNHPGQPVYVVGHSGGGGVAVFTAEGLSKGRQLDGLILLSASIHSEYDLTKALSHCKQGIVNFYNEDDIGLLAIGTTLISNVDGRRGPSAGLSGFKKYKAGNSHAKVYQRKISTGIGDPHTAATRPSFVRRRVAPWINSVNWAAEFGSVAVSSSQH